MSLKKIISMPCELGALGPYITVSDVEATITVDRVQSFFKENSSVTHIRIPEGVTIGYSAFSGCSTLKSVIFEEGVTIGYSAFSGCSGLKSAAFSENVKIGFTAFEGCSGL